MKIKEYNKIRNEVFKIWAENEEVANTIKTAGGASVYDVRQGDKHAVLVVAYKTQMNDNTLRAAGFNDPENTYTRLLIHLNGQTKCADL